jgi:hypothetical protein
MGDISANRFSRRRNRLPPQRGREVVTIGQLAKALGRSTAWLRTLDWLLKPIRLADGMRVYHVERALMFVGIYEGPAASSAARDAYEHRCERGG